VVAQAFTFLLAGMETTANSLAFAIYLLATHPEAEARLVAEINDLRAAKAGTDSAGAHTGLPDLVPEDLERLPYTGAVLSEAMRLLPATGVAARLVAEPIDLGPHHVPAGCNALVAICPLHRDPAIWPEALAFRPERWLQEGQALAARKAHAFLPFGGEARMCVGYKLALQVSAGDAVASRTLWPVAGALKPS
jgi:cytochrome P450